MKRTRLIRRIATCVFVISVQVVTTASFSAQEKKEPAPSQAPAPRAPQGTPDLPPVQLNGNDVLHHLNQVISWYRHSTAGIRDVGGPGAAIYLDKAKALGAGAGRLVV